MYHNQENQAPHQQLRCSSLKTVNSEVLGSYQVMLIILAIFMAFFNPMQITGFNKQQPAIRKIDFLEYSYDFSLATQHFKFIEVKQQQFQYVQ